MSDDASIGAWSDASREVGAAEGDALARELTPAPCAWCGKPIAEWSSSGRRRRADAETCSKQCRQNRWAWKVAQSRLAHAANPMRFAYADPPYPGRSHLYPERTEVDHAELVDRLVTGFPDGWALSTSSDGLQLVLGLCPPGVRVASWHRAVRRVKSARPLSAWEPLIICGGRALPLDDVQHASDALIARGRHRAYPGALVGMKPPAFAVWMFEQLGARPGDELVDLYPGSGAISRAWQDYTATPATKAAEPG